MRLDTLTFNMLARDAICMELDTTPHGSEYLDTAWRIQKTEPDMNALKEKFNK